MSVVTGDQQEEDNDDVTHIQYQEASQELKIKSDADLVTKYPGKLLSLWSIVFITSVS